jgi:ribonuclease BN (tRNA processing enzyme)
MRVTFLGTNGWFDTPTGNTISTLIETKDRYIVLDAGNGIWKLDRLMTRPLPVDLYISHFHLDHICGLHTLVKFLMPAGLRIIGQKGTREALDRIINRPYTVPLSELPYEVEVVELNEGENDLGYPVEMLPLVHTSTCMGYRLGLEGKVVTYCTDTGECDNIRKLGRNADLLILECSFRRGGFSKTWPHLNPEQGIALGKETRAKRLALTHFDAYQYPTLEARKEVEALAGEFPGLIVAKDDLTLQL